MDIEEVSHYTEEAAIEHIEIPTASQRKSQRDNEPSPIQTAVEGVSHEKLEATYDVRKNPDSDSNSTCAHNLSFSPDDFSSVIEKFALPWGGRCDEMAITNTCAMDCIFSILSIKYHTSDSFQSLVMREARNGDIVCQVLCSMFSTTDEILWTRARMLWMRWICGYIHIGPLVVVKWFKLSFQRSHNESGTIVGRYSYIPEYDFTSDELQIVIDPLLCSTLCKFIGDINVCCTCCNYYKCRKNVKIEVDKLLLRWASGHLVIADSSGTQLKMPIEEILNLVVGHHPLFVACKKCQNKGIIQFGNVTLPPFLPLSVRMFHKYHHKYNRLDAVPLSLTLRGIQYQLLGLTDYFPHHFKAYLFQLHSGFYEYDPALLRSKKSQRVERNTKLHEVQAVLYLSDISNVSVQNDLHSRFRYVNKSQIATQF